MAPRTAEASAGRARSDENAFLEQSMKTLFVGGGNMASAMLGGLVARGVAAADLSVVEPDAAQRARLSERFGVAAHASMEAVLARTTDDATIVLAVKPQQMRGVAQELAPGLGGRLVVSIAAGIRALDLSRWLGGHARIVRAMPNTPALVGAGITGLAALPGLSDSDRERAGAVVAACGATVWVDDESLLDAVTAVSGSGPAYVFYFMEAMLEAARGLGLDDAQARALTVATFQGASLLAARSDDPPAVLRERVTSRGGTTHAALETLRASDVAGRFVQAIRAAHARSVELGDEFGRD